MSFFRSALLALAALLPAMAMSAELEPLFARLEGARRIVEGPAQPKSVVYVFFDPNCYYCNLTWRSLQPYERAGLQARWVPVAYQKDNSAGMAAAMLLARVPTAALHENETRYRAKNYDGGVKPLAAVPPDIQRALDDNLALMQSFGGQGTPVLVWKNAQGGIETRIAMPKLSDLPGITGLPAQKQDDPELAPFR